MKNCGIDDDLIEIALQSFFDNGYVGPLVYSFDCSASSGRITVNRNGEIVGLKNDLPLVFNSQEILKKTDLQTMEFVLVHMIKPALPSKCHGFVIGMQPCNNDYKSNDVDNFVVQVSNAVVLLSSSFLDSFGLSLFGRGYEIFGPYI